MKALRKTGAPQLPHGGGVRGGDLLRRSPQFEGRFGRMFRALPAAEFDRDDLENLARGQGELVGMSASPEVVEDQNGNPVRDPKTGFLIPQATPESENDDEENFGIPSGLTYLGQFIDHDLTFDPMSSLQKMNDPDGLIDFRTPRFDLDSVYGRGPADQPYLFEADGLTMALGRELTENGTATGARDLPRFNGRALIGDKRNDENVIISQLHGLFLRFHNFVLSQMPGAGFEQVARQVRWHYQWIVLHDFLPHIVGHETLHEVLPHLKGSGSIHVARPNLVFFHWRHEPFMPIEFTVAAYRFGHSMVRPIYRLNTHLGNDATQDEKDRGVAGRQFIFAAVQKEALNGFRAPKLFPDIWAIDWSLYFETKKKLDPGNTGPDRVQPAYKIDSSLVNPLAFLPEFSVRKATGPNDPGDFETNSDGQPKEKDAADPSNLALRNLLRGASMGLPSGQSVAKFMGMTPLRDDEIRIGKAIFDDIESNKPITAYGKSLAGNAPLWTYILAEAQKEWRDRVRGKRKDDADHTPVHLGKVGGRIVAEVIVGLILGDSHSYLAQEPAWLPTFRDKATGKFDMGHFIKLATS